MADTKTEIGEILKLAWARSETVRQKVYKTCVNLASQAPEGSSQSAAKEYLGNVSVALDVAEGMCRNATRE